MLVIAICGSLQAQSSNLALLHEAKKRAPLGTEIELVDLLRDLPPFNPDLNEDALPSSVTRWRKNLANADAVLIATPEYGHSLPGALKNGIDWTIQSGELYQKVVAITCAVKAPERGARGLAALEQTLRAVDAQIAWNKPIVAGEKADRQMDALLTHLVEARRETLQ